MRWAVRVIAKWCVSDTGMVKQIEGNTAAIRTKSALLVSCLVVSVIHFFLATGPHRH